MHKIVDGTDLLGNPIKHIVIENENGESISFPADENNPNYQAYLKWLENNNGL